MFLISFNTNLKDRLKPHALTGDNPGHLEDCSKTEGGRVSSTTTWSDNELFIESWSPPDILDLNLSSNCRNTTHQDSSETGWERFHLDLHKGLKLYFAKKCLGLEVSVQIC